VPREPESAFTRPFTEPLATLFTVPNGFNFRDPACNGVDFICWPTVAVSSVEHYQSGAKGIPGWGRVLLVTTLKRGSLYVVPLDAGGKSVAGPISRYFQSENRYRDTAVHPDGRTIYIATDSGGVAQSLSGGLATKMQDPGAILAFTYNREGAPPSTDAPPVVTENQPKPDVPRPVIAGAIPPQFTAAQAAAGKTAYNANCAVCHGSTLRNGTMGTPLAGEYFQRAWAGRTVRDLLDRVHKTMPPAKPGSLPKRVYADVVAWILDVNGAKRGNKTLSADGEALEKMVIP
jgi:mono/diheme cytochrome c family protein